MIDWLILECWSGDIDVYENVRFYASPEYENGKYIYGLADMDLTMMGMDSMSVGFNNFQLHGIIPSALRYNEEFRDMFLTRLGEMLRGPLSDENAQKTLDELRAIVEPERAISPAGASRPRCLPRRWRISAASSPAAPRGCRTRPSPSSASPPRMPPNTSDKSEKYPAAMKPAEHSGKAFY